MQGGEVSELAKEPDLKSGKPFEGAMWVRVPPSPPDLKGKIKGGVFLKAPPFYYLIQTSL